MTLIGMLAGAVPAIVAARLLERFLFEISPLDPVTLAASVALLVLVAGAASYLPARRAAQVDPLVTLRAS
jgi:ABC-type lipoprotein release transport system permease subunit